MLKRIVFGILLCFLFLMGGQLYYYQTGDFRLSYLLQLKEIDSKGFDYNQDDASRFKEILSQPFSYFDHGDQTYAFISKDEQYILKLFKKDYFIRTPLIHLFSPTPPFRRFFLFEGDGKKQRREKLLKGYKTAYLYDKELTGLLYYHPKIREDIQFSTTLVTGLGLKIPINLSHYVFALQVKVTKTKDELARLLSKGKVEEAKTRISQLLDLYRVEYQKGLHDRDHNVLDNTGFFGDKAIRLDVGRLIKDPEKVNAEFIAQDLDKVVKVRIIPWLRKNYPSYAEEIIKEIKYSG